MQLTSEISNIVPDIIKPFVDLVWFTHQTWILIGTRNTSMLYVYLAAGLGFLHVVTPAFDTLVMTLTRLQAGLRCVFVYSVFRISTTAYCMCKRTWMSLVVCLVG
jgi:hypothetical protein